MPLPSNYHAESLSELLRAMLSADDEDLLVIDPDAETIEELIAVATAQADDLPTISVVARERVLKDVVDDFLVASNAADLVEAGTLSLRIAETGGSNALFVSNDAIAALVVAAGRVAALSTDDEAFVAAANEEYRGRWTDAEEFTLRTPPLSRVRETLADGIGEEARDDFDAVLDSLRTAGADGDELDEVTISLLVAAKNDVLLYDISKWGEDVGIASKATFSRTKTRLEDLGLIDTEKVPIDVGRPRLRLKLGDEDLVEADAADLAGIAREKLS
ncbi:MAG: transcriptional regulator TbsP [Haloferacaceae archaeon]